MAEICISKNTALIRYKFRVRPYFKFFYFSISFKKLTFSCTRSGGNDGSFPIITIINAKTNTENRNFVFIFSINGLISNPIMVKCLEFTKPTMKFHLLSAAHIPGRLAWCHIELLHCN